MLLYVKYIVQMNDTPPSRVEMCVIFQSSEIDALSRFAYLNSTNKKCHMVETQSAPAARSISEIVGLTDENEIRKYLDSFPIEKIVLAFKILEVAEMYDCGYKEIISAMKAREGINERGARYRERHKEDVNKKAAAYQREVRKKRKNISGMPNNPPST